VKNLLQLFRDAKAKGVFILAIEADSFYQETGHDFCQ